MPVSVLKTKLYISPLRPEIVPRPQLVLRLNESLHCKLTLISAPAGFGKTTLLKEWVAAYHSPVAWVSLDPLDNDPIRLWVHIIAALQMVQSGLGESVLSALQAPQPVSIDYVLTDLINEITQDTVGLSVPTISSPRFVLILDDYHLITNRQVHNSLTYFLDNLPPQMHIIISGRADPPWPFARLRACNRMVEMRASDFRFSSQEASTFLNDLMGFDISPGDIAALDSRTEGWIVGLQMAALSMRNREDKTAFIQAFTGTHRFILDYLLEEVMDQQSRGRREFLLKTAILDRMTASLCDTILDIKNSQSTLYQMEQANLFLVPLDDERCWYRYHHLFSELLRNQLQLRWPEQLPILHQRASQWFEDHNYIEEAVQHGFAARDFQRVSLLIEKYAQGLLHQSRYSDLSSWIEALPDALVIERPWLCVYRSWTRHWAGLREGGDDCLLSAEEILSGRSNLQEDEQRLLPGYIALVRAHYALTNEALSATITHAKKALEILPEDDYFARSTAGVALGGAYWGQGDVVRSERAFSDCATAALKGGYNYRASSAMCYVGMQQVKQARLYDAETTYREALTLAQDSSSRLTPIAGYPQAKLGELACEWNLLDQAQNLTRSALDLCNQLGHVDLIAEACASRARTQLARKEFSGVEKTLRQADQLAAETKLDPWSTTWLDDCRVRLWLSTNRLDKAIRWVESSDLQIDSEINYHHDIHHLNLARVLVANLMTSPPELAIPEVSGLLDRLYTAAEQVGWIHHKIKILVLKALVYQYNQQIDLSMDTLSQALCLAKSAGYIRVFIDEGMALEQLFQALLNSQWMKTRLLAQNAAYVRKVNKAFKKESTLHPSRSVLADPLTQREMDILVLLATSKTVPEIAADLFVTSNTVRSHIKHIYSKLDVHRRLGAVQKAHDLNLI